MAISLSKKKSKNPKKVEVHDSCCLCRNILCNVLFRIPAAILLLGLVFLWSSSTTVISGKIVHVCVSSRKLNNRYCLSAGTQPNFETPFPQKTNTSNGIAVWEGISKRLLNVSEESARSAVNKNAVKSIDMKDKDEIVQAMESVEELLQVQRSWRSNSNGKENSNCNGKGIYVYDLPGKFNKDLIGQCSDMVPWLDFCKYFKNDALGEPIPKLGNRWYQTHQYSLEPIFHSRILTHPCRVYNDDEAKLYYVPFYGGLDILRWHFKNVSNEVKDSLSLELVKWLEQQRPWKRNSGKDHVFVLGKISWDFRRSSGTSWGTGFLELDEMQNPMKLLIERQPWHLNEIGIPHPTNFHPHSDQDIISWQHKVFTSQRKSLVSFAGAARPDAPENIRSILINQCTSVEQGKCQFLDCNLGKCRQPETVTELFLDSEFCLQPQGDSPTRKSVFDSLVSGCIPVLFDPFTAYYQYPWHLPEEHERYSVFIDQEEVRQNKVNVVERLMKISEQERKDMRSYIIYELLPGLVYGDLTSQFNNFQDAFYITMNNLLERLNRLKSSA